MLKAFLLIVFRLSLVLIGAITFLPLLWRYEPRVVALVPAAPQFAAAAVILAACLLFLRSRKSAILALCVAAWNLVQFWPALDGFSESPLAKAEAETAMKVIAFNLWYANADPKTTLAYLAHSGADVIGLVETTPRLKDALAPLKVLYPYAIDCIGTDPSCEIMLLSKQPLRNAYAGRIEGRYPYVAEAEITWGGHPITIAMTHLSRPFMRPEAPAISTTTLLPPQPELPDVPRLTQSLQAANLAQHVNALPTDLVLMGDFNSASWSSVQQSFRAATGLDNRGHLLPSWPSWAWPVLRLPIDYVFVRGRAGVATIATGPNTGSDHLPLEVEISVGHNRIGLATHCCTPHIPPTRCNGRPRLAGWRHGL